MNFYEGIIYGLIQGLAEFLPISSSGHLALLPHFLKIEDPGVLFDLSMHMGTALSIIIYFRVKVLKLIKELLSFIKGNREKYEAVNMLLSTSASFIIILLIKDVASAYGRTPVMIGSNLLVFGLIMWLFDYFRQSDGQGVMEKWQPGKAIVIGVAQALAIFPGVSRSGITLTAARAMNLSRTEGTQYSFLLALPIIIAGFVYKLPEFYAETTTFNLSVCFLGMLVSFFTGILAIHFFLKFVSKMGLGLFFVYRGILALIIFLVI